MRSSFCQEMKTISNVTTIVGVWYIDNMVHEEVGILVIREDGRVVHFPTLVTKPQINQTMRLWYSQFTGDSVRFSGSPKASGWLRKIEATGDGWNIVAECKDKTLRSHCTAADLATLPWWYSEMLEKNLARLDALKLKQKEVHLIVHPALIGDLIWRSLDDRGF